MLILPVGSLVRFAVGSPNAPRASTWSVAGGKSARDVYFAQRASMSAMKFSLHASGLWRLAATESSGMSFGGTGDRVLQRYRPPPLIAPGWRCGASIIVPREALQRPYSEKRVKKGGISWWSPPPLGSARYFHVLISEPDLDFDANWGIAGSEIVARISLPGGGGILISTGIDSQPASLNLYRSTRREWLAENAGRSDDQVVGALIQSDGADGRPLVFDMSNFFDATIY
jgi:hypothetical protein